MERMGDNIDLSFLLVAPNTIRVQSGQVEATSSDISPPNSTDKPTFGPRPNTHATDFDFEAEIQNPPFKLYLGEEAKMTFVQHNWFTDLIYDNPEVFSLHHEDLGFCDQIRHTMLPTMDKPVYLLHNTIIPQLQGEVHKCLDPWL